MVSIPLVVEFIVLILYLVSLYVAYRIKKLDFLIYATVFAFLFENFAVLFFASGVSGYFYSEDFLFYLLEVPLFVILSWGILLLGAHLVSLKLRMSKVSRVFFVAFFVALVDFVIEGVSVNLGYWTWLGATGGSNVFSSIVAGNFIGWLGVSFGFILCYEYLDRKWLSMFLGYLVFLALGAFSILISWMAGPLGYNGYFSLVVILFLLVGAWIYFYHKNKVLKKNREDFRVNFKIAKWVVSMRAFFYAFGLFYFFWGKYYFDLVYVVVVLLVVLVEFYFFLRFNGFVRKLI